MRMASFEAAPRKLHQIEILSTMFRVTFFCPSRKAWPSAAIRAIIRFGSFLLAEAATHRAKKLSEAEQPQARNLSSGILQVTNPVRWRRASSRKRVLRGERAATAAKRGQPDSTPCD